MHSPPQELRISVLVLHVQWSPVFVSSTGAWAALEKKIKPGNRGFSQNHFLLSVKLLLMCPPGSPTIDVPNTEPAKSEKVIKT